MRYIQRRFGDRLAGLCTHNEPWVVAMLGHRNGIFAPGLKNEALAWQVSRVEPWGFFIVMALVVSGVVSALWMQPLMRLTYGLIEGTDVPGQRFGAFTTFNGLWERATARIETTGAEGGRAEAKQLAQLIASLPAAERDRLAPLPRQRHHSPQQERYFQ